MAPSWLDQLERNLEERLNAFLRSNPQQDQLLRQQHLHDRQQDLQRRRRQLQEQAQEHRRQLLSLAREVRDWRSRSDRARAAGADALSRRAEAHTQTLMDQGRQLWEELGLLGQQFRDLDHQLDALHKSAAQQQQGRSLDEDWALFEAQQELDELRRRQGLS
jgi:hercynine metabolism protein